MNKNAKKYIELICCDIRNNDECVLVDVPCENCPYSEYITNDGFPCYKKALIDLEDILEGE